MRGAVLMVLVLLAGAIVPGGASGPDADGTRMAAQTADAPEAADASDAATHAAAAAAGTTSTAAGTTSTAAGTTPTTGTTISAASRDGIWIWSDPAIDANGDAVAERALAVAADLARQDVLHHLYPHLDMVALRAPAGVAAALVDRHGGRVDANEQMELHLDQSVPYIEADRVREAVGLQRDGPTILVVDTGIDSGHPDFRMGENLVANAQADRTGGLVTGTLANQPVVDVAGHGTHVAGIAAGLGASLGDQDPLQGRYQGVYGNGRIAGFQATTEGDEDIQVDTVAALEAFDWAIEHRDEHGILVVTNSWGLPGDAAEAHPVNQGSLRLYLNGMTVVFSAGNDGIEGPGTLNKYCLMPWVLCVAAADLGGVRGSFSSYGRPADPSRPWDHPDLSGPGVQIRAPDPPSRAPGSLVPSTLNGESSASLYRDRSGTSMAAPHVAGTAALVLAANPALSPDQVMDVLVGSTDTMADDVPRVGTGYLNARKAYNLAVQTIGNRDAFLAGQEVKYAGSRTGDPDLANDPVSQGFDGELVAGPTLAPSEQGAWVLSPYGAVVAGLLVAATLLNVLLGIRLRRPQE